MCFALSWLAGYCSACYLSTCCFHYSHWSPQLHVQRCGRAGRLIQLVDNLIEAYTMLEPYICFVESGSLKAKLVADVQGVLIVENIG